MSAPSDLHSRRKSKRDGSHGQIVLIVWRMRSDDEGGEGGMLYGRDQGPRRDEVRQRAEQEQVRGRQAMLVNVQPSRCCSSE